MIFTYALLAPQPVRRANSTPEQQEEPTMDPNAKKTALRMVPYGIYVLTAKAPDGTVAAATVNWVTQTAFAPPLVVAGIKTDSGAYATTRKAGAFALNMLGKGQQSVAFTFFKPTVASEGKLSGEPYRNGSTGAPVLLNAPACIECKVVEVIERGDHHIFVGEVVDAHLTRAPEGRPDAAILEMKDLGEKTFYGG
jgi:flavin reductase (DIM6/NTAB) family NADH-FMN oxidoreductase RutF